MFARFACTGRAALIAKQRDALLDGRGYRQYPVSTWEVTRIALWVAFEIVLMFGFRLPEITRRFYFCTYPARPYTRRIDVGNCLLGNSFLHFIDIINARAIGQTNIITLSIFCARIMNLKKELEQLAKADDSRIKLNFNTLGMRCLLYTSPSPRDQRGSRMPSSA